jgi:hypothetical protein
MQCGIDNKARFYMVAERIWSAASRILFSLHLSTSINCHIVIRLQEKRKLSLLLVGLDHQSPDIVIPDVHIRIFSRVLSSCYVVVGIDQRRGEWILRLFMVSMGIFLADH